MTFDAWLETDQGREELETLTSGPVSEYAATMALQRAWNAADSARVVGLQLDGAFDHAKDGEALGAYLDGLEITGATIGGIRRSLLHPFECPWNGLVRDMTAARERRSDTPSEVARHDDTERLDFIGRVCDFQRELLQDCPGDGNTVIYWDDPATGKRQSCEGKDFRDALDGALGREQ